LLDEPLLITSTSRVCTNLLYVLGDLSLLFLEPIYTSLHIVDISLQALTAFSLKIRLCLTEIIKGTDALGERSIVIGGCSSAHSIGCLLQTA
jgi:hypothetical protein